MIYKTTEQWLQAPQKRVCVFGMSGLGKTYLARMLRDTGEWYHYSVDYRIGTRYLGEAIADNAKQAAMDVPLLRELLLSDSIYIGSNITFENLAPLSSYLGKPGDPALGGIEWDEYRQRQEQHRVAEIAALQETGHFITRAERLYGYPHFICDTGGSICEVVDPSNPDDPVLNHLRQHSLLVWLKGTDTHRAELIRRFDAAPKPIYYNPEFLLKLWHEYLEVEQSNPAKVNPDAFIRWAYARLLDHRQPRYEAMARHGVTLELHEIEAIQNADDFMTAIARKLA